MIAALFDVAPSFAGSILGNTTNQSFNKAKKILLQEVYADHHLTFYCGSEFDDRGKILFHTGGYQPRKEGERAYRVEWEHIVPAQAFGQSFAEWRDGHPECVDSKGKSFKGRNCAGKMSIPYRYMEADMHNLVPAIGELNGLRSNYSFAMIPGGQSDFGACEMKIEDRKAEPPAAVRGNIARTYFYMDAAYPGRGVVSNKNRKLFQAWDKADPVDWWECKRSKRVEMLQGNANPFVKDRCQEIGLW
ncbi:MAG: endonuclease [Desulfuromonadales bacterium]|nr:endonuclease [Desulfuromonadales bacterium]